MGIVTPRRRDGTSDPQLMQWMHRAGTTPSATVNRLPARLSPAIGVLLNTCGLTELTALTAGYQTGLLNQKLYPILVLMAVTTTAMTGPLLAVLGVSRPHSNVVALGRFGTEPETPEAHAPKPRDRPVAASPHGRKCGRQAKSRTIGYLPHVHDVGRSTMSENWTHTRAGELAAVDTTPREPREDFVTSTPPLARGLLWSDVVAEIERDNQLRDAA